MKNYCYKLTLLLLTVMVFSACKSTKEVAYSPVGTWDYVVLDLPDGDQPGTMSITKSGDSYTGTLSSDQGSVDLEDVKIEDNIITATFNLGGYSIDMEGTFEGEVFTGKIMAEGYDFAMKGNRKP